MVWQRNDDQYGVSRKVTRIPRTRRVAAVGLDQLAKNYSVRALTDGVLDSVELEEVLATRALVAELVKVDMWHEAGHGCGKCVQPPVGGIVIHDFLEYNPSRVQVESQREAERVRKASQRDRKRTPDGTPGGSDHPVPVPGPVPLQTDHGDSPSHVLESVARDLDDDLINEFLALRITTPTARGRVLNAVRSALPFGVVSDAEVVDVAREIMTLATDHVRFPVAYIEVACREKPETVRGIWERSPKPPAVVA